MIKIVAPLTLVVAAVFLAPVATAAPDTHVPNGDTLWCQGGRGMAGMAQAYCRGEPFPDGTFLNQFGSMTGMMQPLSWTPPECIDPGGAPAPSGCKP